MNFDHLERIGLFSETLLDGVGVRGRSGAGEEAWAARGADVALRGPHGVADAGSDDDDEVLFEAQLAPDVELVRLPRQVLNEFFLATFSVASMAPTFSADVILLGPESAPLGHVEVAGLEAAAAARIAAALARLSGASVRKFLHEPQAPGPAEGVGGDVPCVAAVTDVFRLALACGASCAFAGGFADAKEAVCCYFDALCDSVRPEPSEFLSLVAVHEPLPSIYCIEAGSSFVLGKMFLRAQEYYECPGARIRRHRFTLDDYKAWCRDEEAGGEGAFRYYVTWPGFNVPSWVLDDLRAGALGPLEPWEHALLSAVPNPPVGRPYYVIGTSERDPLTLRHELAHGLWTTNSGYRAAIEEILGTLSDAEQRGLRSTLIGMGYADDDEIIADETQAYMCEGNTLESGREDACAAIAETFDRFSGNVCCAHDRK